MSELSKIQKVYKYKVQLVQRNTVEHDEYGIRISETTIGEPQYHDIPDELKAKLEKKDENI